jgi:hypothetical protein
LQMSLLSTGNRSVIFMSASLIFLHCPAI